MNRPILNNWSLTKRRASVSPELGIQVLQGTVTGHPRHADGKYIITSRPQGKTSDGCGDTEYHIHPRRCGPRLRCRISKRSSAPAQLSPHGVMEHTSASRSSAPDTGQDAHCFRPSTLPAMISIRKTQAAGKSTTTLKGRKTYDSYLDERLHQKVIKQGLVGEIRNGRSMRSKRWRVLESERMLLSDDSDPWQP